MRKSQYRFYDLEIMLCDDGHGFWLEAGEDQKVLAFMKKEEEGLERKVLAEDRWASHMTYLRSGKFFDRVRSLFD
jgi:Zn-finger nucleic acid-binding protein